MPCADMALAEASAILRELTPEPSSPSSAVSSGSGRHARQEGDHAQPAAGHALPTEDVPSTPAHGRQTHADLAEPDELEAAAQDFEARFRMGGIAALLSEAEAAVAELSPMHADQASGDGSSSSRSGRGGLALDEPGIHLEEERSRPAAPLSTSSEASLLGSWASPRNILAQAQASNPPQPEPPSPVPVATWLAAQAEEGDADADAAASPLGPSEGPEESYSQEAAAEKEPQQPYSGLPHSKQPQPARGSRQSPETPAKRPMILMQADAMPQPADTWAGATAGNRPAQQQESALTEQQSSHEQAVTSPDIAVPHIATPHFPLPRPGLLELPSLSHACELAAAQQGHAQAQPPGESLRLG